MKRIGLFSLVLLMSMEAGRPAGRPLETIMEDPSEGEGSVVSARADAQRRLEEERAALKGRQPRAGEVRERPSSLGASTGQGRGDDVVTQARPRAGSLGSRVLVDRELMFTQGGGVAGDRDLTLETPTVRTASGVDASLPSEVSLRRTIVRIKLPDFRANLDRMKNAFPKFKFPRFNAETMWKSVKEGAARASRTMRNLLSFLNRHPESIVEPVVKSNAVMLRFVSADKDAKGRPIVFEAPMEACAFMYADLESMIQTGNVTAVTEALGASRPTREQAIVMKRILDYYSAPERSNRVNAAWSRFVKTPEGQAAVDRIGGNRLLFGDPASELRTKIRELLQATREVKVAGGKTERIRAGYLDTTIFENYGTVTDINERGAEYVKEVDRQRKLDEIQAARGPRTPTRAEQAAARKKAAYDQVGDASLPRLREENRSSRTPTLENQRKLKLPQLRKSSDRGITQGQVSQALAEMDGSSDLRLSSDNGINQRTVARVLSGMDE